MPVFYPSVSAVNYVAGTGISITGTTIASTLTGSNGVNVTGSVISAALTGVDGISVNGGTLTVRASETLAGGGALTITPTNSLTSVVINGGSVATTLNIGPPAYSEQGLTVAFTQGATAEALNFGSMIQLGTILSSFTVSASPTVTDYLYFISNGATNWDLMAVNQGFTA